MLPVAHPTPHPPPPPPPRPTQVFFLSDGRPSDTVRTRSKDGEGASRDPFLISAAVCELVSRVWRLSGENPETFKLVAVGFGEEVRHPSPSFARMHTLARTLAHTHTHNRTLTTPAPTPTPTRTRTTAPSPAQSERFSQRVAAP